MFPVWSSPMLTVEFGHIWDMEISRVVLQIVFVAKKHKWIFPKKKKIRRPKSGVLVCFSLLDKIPEACSRFRLLEGPNGMVSQTWQEFWLHHSMGDKQKWDWIHAGGAKHVKLPCFKTTCSHKNSFSETSLNFFNAPMT